MKGLNISIYRYTSLFMTPYNATVTYGNHTLSSQSQTSAKLVTERLEFTFRNGEK